MNLTRREVKNRWRRKLQPTPRSGKLLGYIFAWLMVTGAIRISFFKYENFWINLGATLFWLVVGDFIGSKTFDPFMKFVHKIRGAERNLE